MSRDKEFQEELTGLINKYSFENKIDMPDFMMAEMICDYLNHLGHFYKKQAKWFGKGYWDKSPVLEEVNS